MTCLVAILMLAVASDTSALPTVEAPSALSGPQAANATTFSPTASPMPGEPTGDLAWGTAGSTLGVPSIPVPLEAAQAAVLPALETEPETTSKPASEVEPPSARGDELETDTTIADAAEAALPPTPVLLDQPDPAVVLGIARAAATTGVPDGTSLTPMTGEVRVRTAGQIIDGVDLIGCLIIEAPDVIIRNSRISCLNPTKPSVVHVVAGSTNLLVEDSEIDGLGAADIGIGWNNYTLRRVEIRNVADGAKAGTNVTIEDSWIHDIVKKGDLHPDAIQSTGGWNIVIRRNLLNPMSSFSANLLNSAIMLGSENGNGLHNVLVENNVLIGGNYTVNIRGDTDVDGIVFRGNTFNGPRRYGPIQAPPTVVFEDNIDLVTAGALARVRLVYS